MCAISDGDCEKVNSYRGVISPYENTKNAECFVNYIKGVAANEAGDRDECKYRMMLVKDNYPKTVFAWLADDCLNKLEN
jgi:hypothetical protein